MTNFFEFIIDFILHIDKYIAQWVETYQTLTYIFLFLIIFCETGFVVTPLLPGDSLLFAAGSICALDNQPLNIALLIIILITAAFSGDNTNYFIGKFIGNKVYEKNYRLIKREYLDKTRKFYEKHGGKTVIFGRFMPIVRTFVPFVAGVGAMKYPRFVSFSIIGNLLWVNLFSWGGYFFGSTSFVKNNFSLVIIAIIIISLLPVIVGAIKAKAEAKVE